MARSATELPSGSGRWPDVRTARARAYAGWAVKCGLVGLMIVLTILAASIGLIVPARIPELPVRPGVVAEQLHERPD